MGDHLTATTAEIAAAAGRSQRWVQQLVASGRFRRVGRGRVDVLSVISGLVAAHEAELSAARQGLSGDRVRDARADEIELRLAERRRELIPQSEALEAMSLLCGKVSAELDGLGKRCTRDVDLLKIIEAEADGAKGRIADTLGKLARQTEGSK